MALTEEESQTLAQIGTIIYYGIVVLIVDCTLYGFYLLAAFIALYLFIKHGLKRRMQQLMFFCTMTTMTTATWDFVNQCALNLIQIKVSLMEPLDAGLKAQADAAQHAVLPWFAMMTWPININIIVGNGLVVWRAWVVWHHDRSVKSALVTMMIANTGICLADAIVGTVIRSKGPGNIGNSALDTAQMFISLAVNLAATGLIAVKARQSPELLTEHFGKGRREDAERLVLLLTESGAVLFVFQLLYAIFGRMNITAAQFSPVNIAWSIIATMFNAIEMLYVIAVVIMVIIDRSPLEKLFRLKKSIPISPNEKPVQTKISTLRFADGAQVASSATNVSDVEAQGDSDSVLNGRTGIKSRNEGVLS